MNDTEKLTEIQEIKKKIHDNVAVNDDIICELCDKLISVASSMEDWQSVAFGYIWQADYYFYVMSDMKEVSMALDRAEKYIDEKNPSELLEKFYTLRHLICENSFDTHSAFRYSLTALAISEKMGIYHRIGANYGNLGTYFSEYGCYDEALLYTDKGIEVYNSLKEARPRVLRLMLSNIIQIYLKLDKLELARESIERLRALPVDEKDLKVYIDYGYLSYYSKLNDRDKAVYHLEEMLGSGLLALPNRAYIVEVLMGALEAMMRIGDDEKVRETTLALQDLMTDDEPEPTLALLKLKILYAQQTDNKAKLKDYYREYYDIYLEVQRRSDKLKVDGMRAKIELEEANLEFNESRDELKKLHDLANYDELTGVYNRRYLNIKQDEILNSKIYTQIGFVFFDVDYFKEYNDYYGHMAGDIVIKRVASCLKKLTNEHMAVFRYGGDEFVCLCWGLPSEELGEYTKQVAKALEKENLHHIHSKCSDRVTLSVGYGSKPIYKKTELLTLFNDVDNALYVAKSSGRNTAKSIL